MAQRKEFSILVSQRFHKKEKRTRQTKKKKIVKGRGNDGIETRNKTGYLGTCTWFYPVKVQTDVEKKQKMKFFRLRWGLNKFLVPPFYRYYVGESEVSYVLQPTQSSLSKMSNLFGSKMHHGL